MFWSGKNKGKTVIEYLPDADEIERSPLPRYAQLTMHVLLVAFALFGTWAAVSNVDQVVVAPGRLVNPMPNVVVQPLETSIIQSVEVRQGQIVKKGETLATLDATFVQADEGQVRARLQSLETQIGGLEREVNSGVGSVAAAASVDDPLQAKLLQERRANYQAQMTKLSESAARLRASLATNQQDQQRVASRLKSLKEIEAMQEKMVAQKYGAPLQLLEAQQRTKEVERDLELVIGREQELRRELSAVDAERAVFERGWRQKTMEDLLGLTRERDALQEQLQKADKRHRLVVLTAPLDAVVLEMAKLSPGSIIKEAETFFTLVPLNATLEVEVQIDSLDVGYVKRGQAVHVKLDTFPYQKHGTLDASVRTISEDAFKREASMRTQGTDAYYLARVHLTSTELKNMKEGTRLLPGMTLSAEIVVGQRTILSYLAWPLTKGLNEAIREP
ncbi:MAG: HlyD family type I secretion periplasmic adaptor subunit [Rhodoferax sp.]